MPTGAKCDRESNRGEGSGSHEERDEATAALLDERRAGGEPGPERAGPTTLIYNPRAGGGGPEASVLEGLLRDAGYDAIWRETASPQDIGPALAQSSGLIVIAGGDGTFREVVKRCAGKGRPLALIPMGTANNVARSLGVTGAPREIISRLRRPREVRFDLVSARGPWGDEVVVEGAGIGAFANILDDYEPDEGKNMIRAAGAALDELGLGAPVRSRIEVDGELIEGEYLMLEVMNTRAVGPRLAFAPDADPTDGLLDVVLVKHENREALLQYFSALLAGTLAELPSVQLMRGRTIRINWRGSAFHVDGQSYCGKESESGRAFSARVEVSKNALELWLPQEAGT